MKCIRYRPQGHMIYFKSRYNVGPQYITIAVLSPVAMRNVQGEREVHVRVGGGGWGAAGGQRGKTRKLGRERIMRKKEMSTQKGVPTPLSEGMGRQGTGGRRVLPRPTLLYASSEKDVCQSTTCRAYFAPSWTHPSVDLTEKQHL